VGPPIIILILGVLLKKQKHQAVGFTSISNELTFVIKTLLTKSDDFFSGWSIEYDLARRRLRRWEVVGGGGHGVTLGNGRAS
jgi:hypothetical protein